MKQEPGVILVCIVRHDEAAWWDFHRAEVRETVDAYVAEAVASDPEQRHYTFIVQRDGDGDISIQ